MDTDDYAGTNDAPDPEDAAPGDYILSDDGPLGSLTRVSVLDGTRQDRERWQHPFRSYDDAMRAVADAADADGFYPMVWYQDDRGGLRPVTWEDPDGARQD